jgi:Ca2+-binding RTX toxin-like protein
MTDTKRSIPEADLAGVTGGAFTQGGAGHDTLETGHEADIAFGREGNDLIVTGGGDDQAHGEGGNDTINTGAGNDLAFAGEGNDMIFLGEGNDQGQGGAGNDQIDGGTGQDSLFGGEGNDSLDGGAQDRAADYAEGGAGDDTFIWARGAGNDTFQGGAGHDRVVLSGITAADLEKGLNLWTQGLTMQVDHTGNVSFVNAQGQPQSFSGQLTIGHETFTFQDVERLQVMV